MAQQLIFTSVPRGLAPGSSGYCTAARGASLRTGLIQKLEQMSIYAHRPTPPHPVMLLHRTVELGRDKYHVVSRIREAGLDFTQRTNFIAHHVVLEPQETKLDFSPAELLLGWGGWCEAWEGDPAELPDLDVRALAAHLPRLNPPCTHWQKVTGDAGWAAYPLHFSGGVCWRFQSLDEYELIALMGESLRLRAGQQPERLWETTFTSYLGSILEASRFQWSAWNQLDGLPAGKQLGANGVEVESLGGEPLGDPKMIRAAREGFPAPAQVDEPQAPSLPRHRAAVGATPVRPESKVVSPEPSKSSPSGRKFFGLKVILSLVVTLLGAGLVTAYLFVERTRASEVERNRQIGRFYDSVAQDEEPTAARRLLLQPNLEKEPIKSHLTQILEEYQKDSPDIDFMEKEGENVRLSHGWMRLLQLEPSTEEMDIRLRKLVEKARAKKIQTESRRQLKAEILRIPQEYEKSPEELAALGQRWKKEFGSMSEFQPVAGWMGLVQQLKEGKWVPTEVAQKFEDLLVATDGLKPLIGDNETQSMREFLEKKRPAPTPVSAPQPVETPTPEPPIFAQEQAAILAPWAGRKLLPKLQPIIGNGKKPLLIIMEGMFWPDGWEKKSASRVFVEDGKLINETNQTPEKLFQNKDELRVKDRPYLLVLGENNLFWVPKEPLKVNLALLREGSFRDKMKRVQRYAENNYLSDKVTGKETAWAVTLDSEAPELEIVISGDDLAGLAKIGELMTKQKFDNAWQALEKTGLKRKEAEVIWTNNKTWLEGFLSYPTTAASVLESGSMINPKITTELDQLFSGFTKSKMEPFLESSPQAIPTKKDKLHEILFSGFPQPGKAEDTNLLTRNKNALKHASERLEVLRKVTGLSPLVSGQIDATAYNDYERVGFFAFKSKVEPALQAWRMLMKAEQFQGKTIPDPVSGSEDDWFHEHLFGSPYKIYLKRKGQRILEIVWDPPS